MQSNSETNFGDIDIFNLDLVDIEHQAIKMFIAGLQSKDTIIKRIASRGAFRNPDDIEQFLSNVQEKQENKPYLKMKEIDRIQSELKLGNDVEVTAASVVYSSMLFDVLFDFYQKITTEAVTKYLEGTITKRENNQMTVYLEAIETFLRDSIFSQFMPLLHEHLNEQSFPLPSNHPLIDKLTRKQEEIARQLPNNVDDFQQKFKIKCQLIEAINETLADFQQFIEECPQGEVLDSLMSATDKLDNLTRSKVELIEQDIPGMTSTQLSPSRTKTFKQFEESVQKRINEAASVMNKLKQSIEKSENPIALKIRQCINAFELKIEKAFPKLKGFMRKDKLKDIARVERRISLLFPKAATNSQTNTSKVAKEQERSEVIPPPQLGH